MKLKWTLNEIRAKTEGAFHFSGTYHLTEELTNRSKDILSAEPAVIDGWIVVEDEDEFFVDATIQIELEVPSSRSLTPVWITVDAKLQETYVASGHRIDPEKVSENDIVFELKDENLDLTKPVVDTIILNIPTKVLTEKERTEGLMPSGNEWKVISEDGYNNGEGFQKTESDSPFAELKSLFDEDENDND